MCYKGYNTNTASVNYTVLTHTQCQSQPIDNWMSTGNE